MQPDISNLWSTLYGAIFLQGIFLGSILLLVKRGNLSANRYLSAILFVFSSAIGETTLQMVGLYEYWPHAFAVSKPFWYLLGPLYYFYARSLVGNSIRLSPRQALHLLPFFIVLIPRIAYYFLPVEAKLELIRHPMDSTAIENLMYAVLNNGQNIVYLSLSLLVLQKHSDKLRLLKNSWIKLLYSLLTLYVTFHFANSISFYFMSARIVNFSFWAIPIFAIIIYSLAYLTFLKPEKIFIPLWKLWEQKSGRLPLAEMERIVKQLDEIMLKEKLYLDCELRYSQIATKLGVSVRSLSAALNEHAKQSFNDFVNAYRVREVKKQILENQAGEETILAIALNSGFTSKSSFNRVFKNHTGLTPTEFLKSS